jgi:LuxR family transcriptional regulator, maltose regulon positive regulatory protein
LLGASGGVAVSTPEGGRSVKRETADEDQTGAGVVTTVDPVLDRFTIPPQSENHLHRPRLLERLEAGVAGPLTLVSAPAGTGKTVMVSDWASRAQARGPVAWVTVETGDEMLPKFWSSLAQGLKRSGVVVDLPAAQTGSEGADGGYVGAFVSALVDRGQERRAEPVVVILDCEADISVAVAEGLDTLLRKSGGLLRLVVASRVDPVLALHRYRLAGTIAEVRMADLAFTLDEAREIMGQAGLELSETALQAIIDRTQGWGAGLRFAAVALARHDRPEDQERAALDFSGDVGDVAAYLIAEVLDTQPAGGRQLLLDTSIVDVLRPGLSEAVAGPQAQRALAVLVRGNAFLHEAPDSPGFYRYQPLFQELLRAQLAYESPERVPVLHRAAAAWMADAGLADQAVRHSAVAGDWEGAARYVVDDLAIGQLLLKGGDALSDVLARLPDDTDGAAASLVRAALAMAVLDVEACEQHLTRAEGQLDGARTPPWSAAALALQTVRLSHAAALANVEQALACAASAERLVHMQMAERMAGHPELLVLIESGRGSAWLASGHLDDAAEAFSAGARAADRPGCERSLINCLGHLALLAAIRGQLRKAADLAARVAVVQQEASLAGAACPSAAVALAWVNTERYDLPAARRYAQRAAESMPFAHDPTSRVMLSLVESRVRRARGDVDGALARIAAGLTEAPVQSWWLQDVLALEEAELRVVNGQPEHAAQIIERLSERETPEAVLVLARARMATADVFESPASTLRSVAASLPTRVGGWLFEATRQLDGGEELRAGQALERALRLAAPERLRRPFREASPQVRRLLRADPRLAAEHGWLGAATLDDAHALSAPRRDGELRPGVEKPAATPLLEPLTEKEREVLGHLAALLTTDEIAGAMFVSVNTVRTHVRNILRKLAASRRNEAVRRARELGIIEGWVTVERVEPRGGSRPA